MDGARVLTTRKYKFRLPDVQVGLSDVILFRTDRPMYEIGPSTKNGPPMYEIESSGLPCFSNLYFHYGKEPIIRKRKSSPEI